MINGILRIFEALQIEKDEYPPIQKTISGFFNIRNLNDLNNEKF